MKTTIRRKKTMVLEIKTLRLNSTRSATVGRMPESGTHGLKGTRLATGVELYVHSSNTSIQEIADKNVMDNHAGTERRSLSLSKKKSKI